MSEMQVLQALTCPKCHGEMRAYERSGVVVDQCTECRGLFLDRGELERLIAAEGGVAGVMAAPLAPAMSTPAAPTAVPTTTPPEPAQAPVYEAPRDKQQSSERGRGGLLGNVLDIFGGGE